MECYICKEEKSLSNFYKNKSSKSGYRRDCKDCTKKRVNDHRSDPEVKERRRLNAIEYRKTDEGKKYGREYNSNNSDRKRENQLKYYHRNSVEINFRKRGRLANDSFYSKAVGVRAVVGRIKRATNTFNGLLGCTYLEAQNHLYLNNHSSGNDSVSIDHIIPLGWAETENELELLTNVENLHLVDLTENRKKFNKIYPIYYSKEILDIYSQIIYRQILKNYE